MKISRQTSAWRLIFYGQSLVLCRIYPIFVADSGIMGAALSVLGGLSNAAGNNIKHLLKL